MKLELYVYSLKLEMVYTNFPQTWHTYFLNQDETFQRSKLRNSALGSSLREGGFCNSETKHSRKTAPRPKLFRRGDYRNKGHNPEKTGLGWISGEDGFRDNSFLWYSMILSDDEAYHCRL
jgi:hypothetical protein